MRLSKIVAALVLPSLACGGGDGGGITDSSAPRTPLVAEFSVSPEGKAIADVTALELTAAPGAGTYTWDFGDGTSATGAKVTKTFRTTGAFRVILTVADGGGSTRAERVIEAARLDGYWADRVGGLGNYGVAFEQQGTALSGELVTWRRGCGPAKIRGTVSGRTLRYSGQDECGHFDSFEGTIDDAVGSFQGELQFTETDGHRYRFDIHLKRQP